jgi:hypothetical protein
MREEFTSGTYGRVPVVALHRIYRLARGKGRTAREIRQLAESALKVTIGQSEHEPLQERLCSYCGFVRSLDEFERDPDGRDGRSYRCLYCKRKSDNARTLAKKIAGEAGGNGRRGG